MPALRKPFPHRWWYHGPKQRSHPRSFAFKVYRYGGDEYCNPTFYVGLPFLGAWVVRYRRGPIRTEACGNCQAQYGPWCEGCQSCHKGPRCHDWSCCPHTITTKDCPDCGGWYCPLCEPDPSGNCLEKP